MLYPPSSSPPRTGSTKVSEEFLESRQEFLGRLEANSASRAEVLDPAGQNPGLGARVTVELHHKGLPGGKLRNDNGKGPRADRVHVTSG